MVGSTAAAKPGARHIRVGLEDGGLVRMAEDDEGRGEGLHGGQHEGLPPIHRIRGEEVRQGARRALRDGRNATALPRDVDDGQAAAFRARRVRGRQSLLSLRGEDDGPSRKPRGPRDQRQEAEPLESKGSAFLRIALARVVGQEPDGCHGIYGLVNSA